MLVDMPAMQPGEPMSWKKTTRKSSSNSCRTIRMAYVLKGPLIKQLENAPDAILLLFYTRAVPNPYVLKGPSNNPLMLVDMPAMQQEEPESWKNFCGWFSSNSTPAGGR